jgi:hypothetical protein
MFALEKYTYLTNLSGFEYEFESLGNKGAIKKIARFTKVAEPFIYNFGFGDLDEKTGEINDNIASNNGDQEKIMGTLGNIIYDFTTLYADAQIYIEGNDAIRNRLYQISISKYWAEIDTVFEVYGLIDNKWQKFRKGVNYEAFLGRRKW